MKFIHEVVQNTLKDEELFFAVSGLLVTSDIEEYRRIYQNIQRYSLENDIYYHRYSSIFYDIPRSG